MSNTDSESDSSSEIPKSTPAGHYTKDILEELKLYLPEYLKALGVFMFESGSSLRGLCPVHDDNNPSFSVYGENHDRCKCFACDAGGDAFALSLALGRAQSFPQAVRDVAKLVGYRLPILRYNQSKQSSAAVSPSKAKTPRAAKAKEKMYGEDVAFRWVTRHYMREAIRRYPEKIDEIARNLGIPATVIKQAARGASGLGLVDGTTLAYIYPEGVKIRNAPGQKKRFVWELGRAYAPWRFDRVSSETTTIYLTEGESDALALIAAGIEANRTTVVVASPSTSFPKSWAPLFTGKIVVVCFDFDARGQEAAEKVARILSPYTEALSIVRP